MGKDTTQPTPIATEEYDRFREFVDDVHGQTRGHLRTELENALREYRESYYGGNQLQRIENDVATIKANVADTESDGGKAVPTASEAPDARPHGLKKPAANQPRNDKIEYLIAQYLEQENCNSDGGKLVLGRVEALVEREYNFDSEILDEYVEGVYDRIKDRFDPEKHPLGNFFVWGDELEAAKLEARQEADEELAEVAD